jgi:hypothetical protein
MDVCVCLSGTDGTVVEGRAKLFRHHHEVGRVQIPPGWATQKGERRREGGRRWPGKVPRSSAAPTKEADRKVPDRLGVVKGERLKKNRINCNEELHPNNYA